MHRLKAHRKLHPILELITTKGLNHTLFVDEHDTHFLSVIIGTLSILDYQKLHLLLDDLDKDYVTYVATMGDLLSLKVTFDT